MKIVNEIMLEMNKMIGFLFCLFVCLCAWCVCVLLLLLLLLSLFFVWFGVVVVFFRMNECYQWMNE